MLDGLIGRVSKPMLDSISRQSEHGKLALHLPESDGRAALLC